MEVAFVVGILLYGLVVGAAARFAVPGPDPMPVWLTVVVGVVGSVAGGLVAQLFTDSTGSLLFAFAGAVALVIAYRRIVQKRGITGPDASAQPTRGIGIAGRDDPSELLRKLTDLRDAGVITPEEFEAKSARLRARV